MSRLALCLSDTVSRMSLSDNSKTGHILECEHSRVQICEVARQSSWQSCEMLGTDIDLGQLWVRMLCFEDCKEKCM